MSHQTMQLPSSARPAATSLRCKGWQQEAALRCLMNNLDPEVAERPAGPRRLRRHRPRRPQLGMLSRHRPRTRASRHRRHAPRPVRQARRRFSHARNGPARHHRQLQPRGQMGHLGALQRTRSQRPDDVRPDDRRVSWIYIGTQGILQGTFQTFAALAERHFGGTLKGKLVVTGGMGGMGGAQPLSVTLNDGVVLAIDVDRSRIERRVETRYCDTLTENLDEALRLCESARREGRALSVGLVGNCADVLPEIVRRGVQVDVVTDQTSAHDPLNGYVPQGLTARRGRRLAQTRSRRIRPPLHRHHGRPRQCHARPAACRRRHLRLRQQHPPLRLRCRMRRRLPHSRLRPRIHSPALLHRPGAVPLGRALRRSQRHRRTDELALELFPENEILTRWMRLARGRFAFQGLPARICWLGYGERAQHGRGYERPRQAREKSPRPSPSAATISTPAPSPAPIAKPKRCSTARDAVADWPILNCASQYRFRRNLGQLPPRRRRRHGLLAPCRPGHRGRRHRHGLPQNRPRPQQRPRHRRSPPRRRRLRTGPANRQEKGIHIPMAGKYEPHSE